MKTIKIGNLSWHHVLKPRAGDLKKLQEEFGLLPSMIEELGRETIRPKVDAYNGYLYVVLHFPIHYERERRTHAEEVDFVLTDDALVTIAYRHIRPLEELIKKLSPPKAHGGGAESARTPAHLLCYVVKELYTFALRELDHIQGHIDRIEEKVFSQSEREEERLIEELSVIRRDVIDFRKALKPQQSTLSSLRDQAAAKYGLGLKPSLESLISSYEEVWNIIENHSEAVDALYENNTTILGIKQNEAMRILAIMAFVTFPLVLFAQLFSMSTVATPIIGHRYDFWIIVAIMLAAVFGMFLFFKSRKWL